MDREFIENLINWCQGHDWGTRCYYDNGMVRDLDEVVLHPDGDVTVSTVSLPARLPTIRAWAGY